MITVEVMWTRTNILEILKNLLIIPTLCHSQLSNLPINVKIFLGSLVLFLSHPRILGKGVLQIFSLFGSLYLFTINNKLKYKSQVSCSFLMRDKGVLPVLSWHNVLYGILKYQWDWFPILQASIPASFEWVYDEIHF